MKHADPTRKVLLFFIKWRCTYIRMSRTALKRNHRHLQCKCKSRLVLVIQNLSDSPSYFQNRGVRVLRGFTSGSCQIPTCPTLNREFGLWKLNHSDFAGMWYLTLVQSKAPQCDNGWIVVTQVGLIPKRSQFHESVSTICPQAFLLWGGQGVAWRVSSNPWPGISLSELLLHL